MSFGDEHDEAPRPTTTRLREAYRLHLIHLRTLTRMCLDGAQEAAMLEAIDDLADTLMAGGPTVVQVALEAERDAAGITSLLDDTASAANSDRDHRVSEVA